MGASAPLPAALYTHPLTGWTWTDFAEGPTAIYASGMPGTSFIYKVDATSSASAVTLSQPVVVAEPAARRAGQEPVRLPGLLSRRGYQCRCSYRCDRLHLLRWWLAHARSSSSWKPRREHGSGCSGGFAHATVGTKGEVGDRTKRAGLWRIDLATNLNNQPLQFASAADVVAPSGTTGAATQVTVAGGRIYFVVAGQGVFRIADTYVTEGWLETGRIRLGTLEAKAWRDMRLTGEPDMTGTVTGFASLSDASQPGNWTQTAQINGTNYDVQGSLGSVAPNRQELLYVAFRLSTDDTDSTPIFTGYQVRAVPAPQRSN